MEPNPRNMLCNYIRNNIVSEVPLVFLIFPLWHNADHNYLKATRILYTSFITKNVIKYFLQFQK